MQLLSEISTAIICALNSQCYPQCYYQCVYDVTVSAEYVCAQQTNNNKKCALLSTRRRVKSKSGNEMFIGRRENSFSQFFFCSMRKEMHKVYWWLFALIKFRFSYCPTTLATSCCYMKYDLNRGMLWMKICF